MEEFRFGEKSLNELTGVHAELVSVVHLALKLSPIDFSVHDGLRTLEEQKNLVASGASKTLESRHLTGHAVDLVPYVNGKMRWEWGPILIVARAVQLAVIQCRTRIRWGTVWDREIQNLSTDLESEKEHYVERMKKLGKRAFLDGPHFELPREVFPA